MYFRHYNVEDIEAQLGKNAENKAVMIMKFILKNKVHLTTIVIGIVSWLLWSPAVGGLLTALGFWLMANDNGLPGFSLAQWGTYAIAMGMLGYYMFDSNTVGILLLSGISLYIYGFIRKM